MYLTQEKQSGGQDYSSACSSRISKLVELSFSLSKTVAMSSRN